MLQFSAYLRRIQLPARAALQSPNSAGAGRVLTWVRFHQASLLSIITGVNDASVLTYFKDTAADRAALLGPNSARDGSVFTWLRLQQPPERRLSTQSHQCK